MKVRTILILLLTAATLAATPRAAFAQTARALYNRALEREREVRNASSRVTLKQLRSVVSAYERLVTRHPTSGYSDNALWQAANLALLAHERFGDQADRRAAMRLLASLQSEYPASSLVSRARDLARTTSAAPVAQASRASSPAPPIRETPRASPAPAPSSETPSRSAAGPASSSPSSPVMIRGVRRTDLPDGVRITLELDAEVPFSSERIEKPNRVFFDLKGARPLASLEDSTTTFDDGVVKEVRFGRHPGATRVVMEMQAAESYSVFTLYDPFRLIVDFKRRGAPSGPAAAHAPVVANTPPAPIPPPPAAIAAPPPALPVASKPSPALRTDSPAAADAVPAVTRPAPIETPSAPSANLDGSFSLSRQLGLGIARVVIDAGHGGHDPGAKANGLSEAELTLDIALRLQKLLEKEPGVEVVMTRATDVFIPLEERTRIANREGADLFLSIHANAARNAKARGIETYFLNFAKTADAEAVAARENAGSAQTMHKLPEIVRAITLNNKINESRDFAQIVQRAMVKRLSARNSEVRDIGVKQAPFIVLIGAAMPSVLAEISFLTNKQEAALLKTAAYRQQIAQALLEGVQRYQQSLKRVRTASTR